VIFPIGTIRRDTARAHQISNAFFTGTEDFWDEGCRRNNVAVENHSGASDGHTFSNRVGLGSFGDVPKRALELTVEIGANGKNVFGSTLVLTAG
jgi:hypothetical protein